jgi:hypothetical protein
VAAPATDPVANETQVAARTMAAVASGSTGRLRSLGPFANTFISTPGRFMIPIFNQ